MTLYVVNRTKLSPTTYKNRFRTCLKLNFLFNLDLWEPKLKANSKVYGIEEFNKWTEEYELLSSFIVAVVLS